jgi:catalase
MPTLGQEIIPANEAALIERLVEQNLKLQDESTRPVKRGQHPKHHGCVRAEFIVEDGLAPELRHGLFAQAGVYDALIRFSNGAAEDDRKGDAHGMAIKLFGVPGDKLLEPGDTHDFVLIDHPVFFSRDVAGYVELFDALIKAKSSILPKLAFFLPRFLAEMGHVYLTHLHNHPVELGIMRAMIAKQPNSPLASTYWSTTPYLLGGHAVKWSARPTGLLAPHTPADSPDKLRIAMAQQLAAGEAHFEFMAQLQTDAVAMPIEDPTREWDAQISPWRKLATLRLPKQKPDTPELMEFCEHLSFNPWRCLPEHRPLGGVNRARRAIYDGISRRRHELNRTPVTEPELEDFKKLWVG